MLVLSACAGVRPLEWQGSDLHPWGGRSHGKSAGSLGSPTAPLPPPEFGEGSSSPFGSIRVTVLCVRKTVLHAFVIKLIQYLCIAELPKISRKP